MRLGRPPTRERRRRGYTLLEVLIAVGILTLLGGALAALLNQGVSIWRRAENRGLVYESARALFEQLAEDLRSTVTAASAGSERTWVRFVADADDLGRQRLRFVRTTSAESADPLLRQGGQYLSVHTPGVYDGRDDAREAREGLLGAPGGLMEVFYARDPRPGRTVLWRGVRTPLGGAGSLFDDDNVSLTKAAAASSDEESPFAAASRPISDGVLFFGTSFWGPTTNTWDPQVPPLAAPRRGQRSGPLTRWDSTRALFDEESARGRFALSGREESLTHSGDDIFPERVEVTLVLRDDDREALVLAEKLAPGGGTLVLSRAVSLPDDARDRFLLVGDEWIAVEAADGSRVDVARGGRGARGTAARGHEAGERVDVGATFRRVIELPGGRRAPGLDDPAPGGDRKERSEKRRRP
jgi:prepilin-type N-terminal cleavage/methylation domain-containing protein